MATRQLTSRQVVNLATDPSGGTPGEIYYNTSSNSFKYYNGTAWVTISGGGDSLPSQTGNAGNYLTTNGTAASWGSITEDVQDIVGGMVSGNTESGISVTYDDTNGKLDFDVNDPTISLTGDVTGSATMTNLGNVSITTSIAANSVELGTDTTGQYVASVSGTTNQVTVSGSGTEGVTLTLSTPQDIHSGANPTFAGATLDAVRVGITAANEIDTSAGNLIIDSAGGTVTVDDNLTVSGNLTVNGTTTTVNSTTLTVDDPIITLGGDTAPSADDGKDRGIEFRYYDTQARLGFMGYNDSTGQFSFLTDATNTSEVFSGTKATINAHISGSNINAGTVSATYIDTAIARLASPTFTGTVIMPTSVSGGASIRIPHGTAPTSLTNGDIWTTTAGVYARIDSATIGPFGQGNQYYQTTAPSSPAVGDIWVDSDETATVLNTNDFSLKSGGLNQFAATTSAQLAGVISDETGTGALVFANSPTLTTPNIGVATGTSFNSITGLSSTTPLANGTATVGTGTTTARADHVHPTTGLGLTSGTLAQFAATTSAQLAGVISDETGSGALVFSTSPTLTTPNIGSATASYLTMSAQDGVNEGGEIRLNGAGSNVNWQIDNFAGKIRFFTSAERFNIGNTQLDSTVPFIFPAATTSATSIRVPHGTAPSAPTNGDIWTTTTGLFGRINGTTQQFATQTYVLANTGGLSPFLLGGM